MDYHIVLADVDALDRDVPIPLYYQVKRFILDQIKNGSWPIGWQIPTEQQFCEKFDISRPTVRQAVGELITEGHLSRRHRKITVSKPKMDGDFFSKLQSFNTEMQAKNLAPSTQVLTLDVRTCEEVSEKLAMEKDTQFTYLERVRYADDDPIVWVKTFIPHNAMPGLASVDFEKFSLYETIERQYQVRIERVDRIFEATLANTRDSELLGVEKGDPICYVKTEAYDQYNQPVEFSVARYRGDRSQFAVSIGR